MVANATDIYGEGERASVGRLPLVCMKFSAAPDYPAKNKFMYSTDCVRKASAQPFKTHYKHTPIGNCIVDVEVLHTLFGRFACGIFDRTAFTNIIVVCDQTTGRSPA